MRSWERCAKCNSKTHLYLDCPVWDKRSRRYGHVRISRMWAAEKHKNRELDAYAQQVAEGNQPMGTYYRHTDEAKRVSDELGRPFRGDDLTRTYLPEADELIGPIESPVTGRDVDTWHDRA